MTISLSSLIAGIVALALQTPTPTPAVSPKPAASPAAGQSTAAARPGALVLTVTSEKGEPLGVASVTAHGAVDRAGTTNPDGTITLQNMPVGTYRCRISRDGFITLEKEIAVRSAARTTAEAVLSVAPAPPPSPPAPSPTPTPDPRPAPETGAPGTPKTLSIPDLAEQMLKDTQPVVDRVIGCSGVVQSRLLVARENIAAHAHPDVDELLYVVAGDAVLTIAGKDQTVAAGWFGLVPRGTSHAVARRGGRNPIVLLLVQSGQPCAK